MKIRTSEWRRAVEQNQYHLVGSGSNLFTNKVNADVGESLGLRRGHNRQPLTWKHSDTGSEARKYREMEMEVTVSATRCKANCSPYFSLQQIGWNGVVLLALLRPDVWRVQLSIRFCTQLSLQTSEQKDGGKPIINIIQYCSLKGIMSCIWHLASQSPYGNCLNKGICRHPVLPTRRILSERGIEGKQKISTATRLKAKEKETPRSRISRLVFRDLRSFDWAGSQVEVLDEGFVTSQAGGILIA